MMCVSSSLCPVFSPFVLFCPLQKALVMIQSLKEKAGDSVQLGLIDGYEGNIHAGGSLVMHVSGSALGYVEGESTAVESNTISFSCALLVHITSCFCNHFLFLSSLPVFCHHFLFCLHFL